MHVVLKVLASTSIKRRKPWPRLVWIGKEKQNFLLLGDRRISILYMPSGKTKRKISKLHALIKDCVCWTYTSNGLYLIGLLTTGNVFVWCKDSDVVSHVGGLVDLQARSQSNYKWRPKLFSSNDCNRFLVVIMGAQTTEIYLYQCNRDFEHCSDVSTDESSEAWWRCGTDIEATPLQSRVSKDVTLDARFVTDDIFGRCCFVAFVYSNESSIQLVTLVIRWFSNNALPVHHWQKMALPYALLSIDAKQVTKKGAFVIRWSHDGRILAIAVNQEAINQDQLVFVSPHGKVLSVAMLPCEYSGLRHHRWICDLAWTHNDLFVVTINQLGSICLLSRLGGPLSIASSGCSMDLPVSLALNIHPFIFVRPHNEADKGSDTATADFLKQRYSICSHPGLPMFLCSDGYMVTCFQFPQPLEDPFQFINVCYRQTEKYLRVMRKCLHLATATMDLTEDHPLVASALHKSAICVRDFEVYGGTGADFWNTLPAGNDTLSESDSSHLKSEQVLLHYSTVGNHDSGSLAFGARNTDGSQVRSTNGKSKTFSLHQLLNDTKKETGSFILSVWGILVTVNTTWTMEWEEQAKKVSDLTVKVCAEFLRFFPHIMDIEQVDPESSFETATSFIVNLMNLFRFCTLNKSIMPVILNTVFSIVHNLIKCARKLPLPLQALHLTQLCNLLKSTEQIFSSVFGTFAYQLLCFSPQNNVKNAFFANGPQSKVGRGNKLSLHNRFTSIWITLYKATVKMLVNCAERNDTCITLMGRLQQKLQSLGINLNMNKRRHKFEKAEKVLICDPFKYEYVVEQWKVQMEASLEGTDDKSWKTSARLLHSILYTLLGGYHLKDAISLIYWLLTRNTALQVDRGLQHPAIRKTIRSFARFMATYFVDKQLYVYPYHHPRYFPSLHKHQNSPMCHRTVPVCRVKLTQGLSLESVAYHWTTDVTIALFLSSGYIKEVAKLVHCLGDWKTAFVLFYASLIASETKSLEPVSEMILKSQLQRLMKSHCSSQSEINHSLQQMTFSFQNTFLAGALCEIDVVAFILEHQMLELQCLIRQLPLVVPTDVYLPHPPPYCPQPSEQNHVSAESVEERLRYQIAQHVQLFIVLLQTLQCTVHFIDIYLSNLSSIAKQIAQVKELSYDDWPLLGLFLKLKEKLGEFQDLHPEQRQKLDSLALHFRDFCAICWFLHVRDKMNMHLRKFWQQILKVGSTPAKFCLSTLHWAVHLIPFAEAAGWNLDVYHLIISVLLEAPRDRRSSLILARCFPDMSQIPTELDYRISSLLNVWRSTVIKVPSNRRQPRTTKTLSVIHLSQCDGVRNTLNQLKGILGNFDKNVFSTHQTEHYTHFEARVFEIEKDYFAFLGLMFDVGIFKDNLENDATLAEIPILSVFKDRLQQQYLVRPLLADQGSLNDKIRKRNAIHEIFVDAESLKEIKSQAVSASSAALKLNCKKSLLFRSLSLSELNKNNAMDISARPLPGRIKSLSNLDSVSTRKKISKDSSSSLPKCSSLLSLCDAIDVDQTWKKSHSRDQMLEVLSWLVKWTKREEFTGNLVEKCVISLPRMKIHITFNQLVIAIQQAVNISSKQKRRAPLPIRKKSVEKGFLMSTLLTEYKLQPKNSTKSKKLREQFSINDDLLNADDFDLVKQSEGVMLDRNKMSTQQLDWTENSKSRQFEMSTLTSNNSFSSLDSDIHLSSEAASVSDDLTSITTSRWTNSGQFQGISSKLKGMQPSAKLAVSSVLCNHPRDIVAEPLASTLSSSTVTNPPNLLPNNHFRTPESMAVSTKDFACGDGSIWGSRLADTCIQVNDESLVGTHIHSARKNEHLIEVKFTSTCDDTQNDACSLPITSSASVDGTHSSQRNLIAPREKWENGKKQHEHTKLEQPISEQKNVLSIISVGKMNVEENLRPDFAQIRLLRLPAEKEVCALGSERQPEAKISTTLIGNNSRRIPALLSLEPECKLIKNISLQAKAHSQPKILSHDEIQHLQSKLQSFGTSEDPKTNKFRKHDVPPLLQLGTSSVNILPVPLQQQKITLRSSKQAACPTESLRDSTIKKWTTHSKGVQTVAERENFTTSSSAMIPNRWAVISQGVQTKTQRGQFTQTSCSQTISIPVKHISTLTDDQQMQHVPTGTDVPRSSVSIGVNTSQEDEIRNEGIYIKHLSEKPEHAVKQTFLETFTTAQETQTEELTNKEGMQNFHGFTDEFWPTDNADKNMFARGLLSDQNRKSGVRNGLEEKIQSAHEEIGDKHTNVIDLKRMKERLDRLKNEGLLNEDMLSLKVKSSPIQYESLAPTSINMLQSTQISSVESCLQRKRVEEPDVSAELLARVKSSRNTVQQTAVKSHREILVQMDEKSLVSSDSTIVKLNIAGTKEQRKKRRQRQMYFNHYEARKSEAIRLMQELVQDETSLVRKMVQLRRPKPIVNKLSPPSPKRDPQDDLSATYVLSRGLRPLKENLADGSHSLPASPSRNNIIASKFISCPASPKNPRTRVQPTTYIERLQALQPPRLKEKSQPTNTVRSQDKLKERMHLSKSVPHAPDLTTASDTSSCETLSPWIVPDEVEQLLFGKTYQSKVCRKSTTRSLNENTKSPAESDNSIDWEENDKIIELHQVI